MCFRADGGGRKGRKRWKNGKKNSDIPESLRVTGSSNRGRKKEPIKVQRKLRLKLAPGCMLAGWSDEEEEVVGGREMRTRREKHRTEQLREDEG